MTKNGRIIFLSRCTVCDCKKLKFIKKQEDSGLLSSLGKKTPLKVKFLQLVLFCFRGISKLIQDIEKKEIVNEFILAGDKFSSEMQLTQPGFTCSACVPFTEKQRKNPKIERNKRFAIYLLKQTR